MRRAWQRAGRRRMSHRRPACSPRRCVPPISSTSRFEMARPSPVPPCRRAGPCSACSNSAKIRSIASGGTPGPVSRTAKRKSPAVAMRRTWREPDVSATPPWSVNLMALPMRFIRIWRTRISSPITVFGRSGAANQPISSPLSRAARGEQLDHALRGVGNVERCRREARSCRPRSWRSRALRRSATAASSPTSRWRAHRCAARRQLGVEQKPGHAENAVHRRSDLMAHRGEEARLGVARGHRLIARVGERNLRRALLGDVAADALDLAHAACLAGDDEVFPDKPARTRRGRELHDPALRARRRGWKGWSRRGRR